MIIFIQDEGFSLESEGFLSSEVRMVAVNNLAKLYSLCKCTHRHTHLNTFEGSSTTSSAAVMIKIAALPAG